MNHNPNVTLRAQAEVRRLLSAWLCQPEYDLFVKERIAARIDEGLLLLGIPLTTTEAWQDELETADARAVLVEFTRLFEGPGKVPAPLYGTLYLDGGQELVGKSTLAVESFYADEGVGVDKELAELPDHAAIELEFSASLLERALAATVSGDTAEGLRLVDRDVEFEKRYLRDWISELGARVREAADLDVYRTLGKRLGQVGLLMPVRLGAARSSEV